MSDTYIQPPANQVGSTNLVDCELITVNGQQVQRQRIILSDPSNPNGKAGVLNADPAQTAYGLVVRPVRGNTLDYHAVAQAGTNAVLISNTARTLYGWSIFNNAGYPVFVKLFNKATTPVPGTDAPAMTLGVQAGVLNADTIDRGIGAFGNGLGVAITKGIADFDSTAVAANDCVVELFYL